MPVTREILESHPVSVLKKEISKTNIKDYSGDKKADIIKKMLSDENIDKFSHIKMAEKKPRKKPVKKVKPNVTELTEKKDKKKKVVKTTTFGPAKPPRGKSKKLKTVVKELDEKGKEYRKARKEFGKDDPLRSKEKKARKPRKLTIKGRDKAFEKLDLAHQRAMEKNPADKAEHDRILNEGYKAIIKKQKESR